MEFFEKTRKFLMSDNSVLKYELVDENSLILGLGISNIILNNEKRMVPWWLSSFTKKIKKIPLDIFLIL